MFENLLNTLKIGAVAVGVFLTTLIGGQQVVDAPSLGASVQTPDVRALFTTTLASRITSSATSMTLSSATDKDGNTLASSTYGFILDEGTSVEEFVLADCTGTACTNMTRGLSVATGTSTVAALQFEHRRGASVKITDAPSLVFAVNVFKGRQNIESPLRYSDAVTNAVISSNTSNLVDYQLLTDTAFSAAGAVDATTIQKGLSELATQVESASSTATGSSGNLVIPASSATSTYNSATAALRVVVTQNNGKIDDNFIATSTLFATSSISVGPIGSVGKNFQFFSASSTFTVPAGVTKVTVYALGGGGGGGGSADDGSKGSSGGDTSFSTFVVAGGGTGGGRGGGSGGHGDGGGGGAYCVGSVDVSATTSIAVRIGNGGNGGLATGASGDTAVGLGGDCSGISVGSTNFFKIENYDGDAGFQIGGTDDVHVGGAGANTIWGKGANQTWSLNASAGGAAASQYGTGGAGATGETTTDAAGGNGYQGLLLVTW